MAITRRRCQVQVMTDSYHPGFFCRRASEPESIRFQSRHPGGRDAGRRYGRLARTHERLRRLLDCAHHEKTGLGRPPVGRGGHRQESSARTASQRWAATEPMPALVLTLANLQAEPRRLPRALLRGVLDMLSLGRARNWRHTPLFRIANGMARHAIRRKGQFPEQDSNAVSKA